MVKRTRYRGANLRLSFGFVVYDHLHLTAEFRPWSTLPGDSLYDNLCRALGEACEETRNPRRPAGFSHQELLQKIAQEEQRQIEAEWATKLAAILAELKQKDGAA